MNSAAILRISAACAVLAGLAMTVQSATEATRSLQHIRRKAAILERLHGIDETLAREHAAIATLGDGVTAPGTPLATLAQRAAGEAQADIQERDTLRTSSGWSVRRIDVSFDEIPLKDLGTFIRAVESERPPWRVHECTIAASGQARGRGRATLVLETVVQE